MSNTTPSFCPNKENPLTLTLIQRTINWLKGFCKKKVENTLPRIPRTTDIWIITWKDGIKPGKGHKSFVKNMFNLTWKTTLGESQND